MVAPEAGIAIVAANTSPACPDNQEIAEVEDDVPANPLVIVVEPEPQAEIEMALSPASDHAARSSCPTSATTWQADGSRTAGLAEAPSSVLNLAASARLFHAEDGRFLAQVPVDGRSEVYARRPVILNGIENFVTRGDMCDRCVSCTCRGSCPRPAVPKRTSGGRFTPITRGSWVACSMALSPPAGDASLRLAESPRMADFARWGEAFVRVRGCGDGTFLATYNENRKDATDVILDDSPLAKVLLEVAQAAGHYSASPAAMHTRLAECSPANGSRHRRLAKNLVAFSNEIRRIAPQLHLHGCSITFDRTNNGRIITVSGSNSSAGQATRSDPLD